jgi:hypothetical protein
MVHKNSLQVYQEQILPNLKAKHKAVMDALAILGPSTSLDVADYLRKPLNAISGRFTELSGSSEKEYGRPLIKQVGSKKNRYNNPCAIWEIIEPVNQKPAQAELF